MLEFLSDLGLLFRTNPGVSTTPRPRSWSFPLQGEQLEDRLVPDAYVWYGEADGFSHIPGNWKVNGQWATEAPGSSDTLEFNGTTTTNARLTTPTVSGIEIKAGYTGTIYIRDQVGNSSNLQVTATFNMAGGTIAKSNVPNQPNSNVTLLGTSLFTWTGGKADGVLIRLGDSMNHEVTGAIAGDVELNNSSALINYGLFTWASGKIKVGAGSSSMLNQSGGIFEIKSTESFAAAAAPERNVGLLQNLGTLKFNTAGVRIAAGFENLGGIVRVYPGQVQFDYQAEQQLSGTFELYGDAATVKLAGAHPLGIRAGTITGAGKIDGNLVLGNVGGPTVTIRPGIEDAVGTINVTGEYHIFATNALTHIRVLDDGKYSKITVGATARLGDSKLMIENSSKWHPAAGTSVDFLTASNGFAGTDFGNKDVAYWGSWMDPGGSGKAVKWTLPVPTGNTYSLVSVFVMGC